MHDHPVRNAYKQFIYGNTPNGSHKATSYVRAIDLLGQILDKSSGILGGYRDVWTINSPTIIDDLYRIVIHQQKLGKRGIFASSKVPSYWRSGFYSAALKSFKEFMVLKISEQDVADLLAQPGITDRDIAARLQRESSKAARHIAGLVEADYRTKVGKEILRNVVIRVNQALFRKMILTLYGSSCCVSGLTIPEVLRASHIIPWAEDADNRLNPTNGLCLSATYDAAFDRHLISLDEAYRIIFSPALKRYCTNQAFQQHFAPYEGRKIDLPTNYHPAQNFLSRHRRQAITL